MAYSQAAQELAVSDLGWCNTSSILFCGRDGGDGLVDILEDSADDATGQELMEFIRSLDNNERAELVALAWMVRGRHMTHALSCFGCESSGMPE